MRHVVGRLLVGKTLPHPLVLGFLDPVLECPAKALASPCGDIVIKEHIDLLQTLFGSFGIQEEDVDRHRRAESAKNHICFPLDVRKRRRNEEGKRKIKTAIVSYHSEPKDSNHLHPVSSSRQSHALGTVLERKDLGSVDPSGRCLSKMF